MRLEDLKKEFKRAKYEQKRKKRASRNEEEEEDDAGDNDAKNEEGKVK